MGEVASSRLIRKRHAKPSRSFSTLTRLRATLSSVRFSSFQQDTHASGEPWMQFQHCLDRHDGGPVYAHKLLRGQLLFQLLNGQVHHIVPAFMKNWLFR